MMKLKNNLRNPGAGVAFPSRQHDRPEDPHVAGAAGYVCPLFYGSKTLAIGEGVHNNAR